MEITLDLPRQIVLALQRYAEDHGISIDTIVADFLAPDFYIPDDGEDEEA